MLVLSRREQDQIVFPSLGITVELIKIRGQRAVIGIDAPERVRIVRQEALTADDQREIERQESSTKTAQYREVAEQLRSIADILSRGESETARAQLVSVLDSLSEETREPDKLLPISGVVVRDPGSVYSTTPALLETFSA